MHDPIFWISRATPATFLPDEASQLPDTGITQAQGTRLPPANLTATADRILDAADRLLGRFGYRKMTIEDLAREAGIGKGTVYLSFESKESIALACIDRMIQRVLGRLRTLAAGPGTPSQRVRAMLIERVMLRLDYANTHSTSVEELVASLRTPLLERRAGYFRAEAEVLAAVITEGRRTASFLVPDPHEAAYALVLATNALLPYSLAVHELGRRAEIERQAGHIADLLLHGLEGGVTGTVRRRPHTRERTSS